MAPKAKWVRPENLHVTLKFLGTTEQDKLAAVREALAAIRSPEPVTLEFRGLGFFPNGKRARVFWAGAESTANLRALAGDIDLGMHLLGFPLEERSFTPHLTLARFDPPGLPPIAREFHLIESRLKPAGAEYTTLQSFPLAPEK